MTTPITPTTPAQEIFDYLAARHAYLQDQLCIAREQLAWRNPPDGERRQEIEKELLRIGSTMIELRDAGRVALGICPADGDDNPFGGSDDF